MNHAGPVHNLVANAFFGGRRATVYRRLAELSGATPGERVLDVGCGDGYLTRAVARRGAAVEGIDPSARAIAGARARALATPGTPATATATATATYREGTALALDAPGDTYDVVVTSLAVHHLDEPERPVALKEMWRVLRPGGRLLVAEFRPPTNHLLRRAIRPIVSPAMLGNDLDRLEPMIGDAGFVDVASGDLHPWIRYVTARKPA